MKAPVRDDDDSNEALLMHEFARQFRVCFDRRAQRLGLTRSQWRVLRILGRNPGIRQSHLAELMEVEPITLVRMLDRMQKAGWIERREDPGDRRANSIVLTGKVDGILTQMQTISQELRQEALEGFSEQELKQLLAFLRRMKSNISRMICAGEGGR
jgi:DNA-binding MarR family transcriptional regulator